MKWATTASTLAISVAETQGEEGRLPEAATQVLFQREAVRREMRGEFFDVGDDRGRLDGEKVMGVLAPLAGNPSR